VIDERKVILVIDDEPGICWAIGNILGKHGYVSLIAKSGEDALRCIKKNHYPLILLDAKLPDIEGLSLAGKIRDIMPSTKIIIISGYFYTDDSAIHEAMGKGLICGFIEKPFCHDEIIKIVDTFFPSVAG
jgi:DNA-binding NtrC family response regulator